MSDNRTAFVPGFDYDVFLSYAWVNNQVDPGTQQVLGWVSLFREGLRQGVDGELGRTDASRLYVDTGELDKNRGWGKQLEKALDRTAVFVMVLSPGYVRSPACLGEIAHFKKVIESNGNNKIWDSGRLFIVRMRPLSTDADDWPEDFPPDKFQDYLGPSHNDNPLGYRFFIEESGRPTPKQLKPTDTLYQDTLEEIRVQVAKQLKTMKKAAKAASAAPTPVISTPSNTVHTGATPGRGTTPTVLLAKTTDDLRKTAKELESWCESARIRVLPEKPWPSGPQEFQQAYRAALKEAHLVVQLLSDLTAEADETFFPVGREKWQFDAAKNAGINVFRLRNSDIDLASIESETHRELVSEADVRPDEQARFFEEVVERVQRAFEVGVGPPPDAEKRRAMIKFNKDDNAVIQMLERLAQKNVQCRTSKNGRPLLDRLREIPFDGLIVVLGECDDDWLEDRGDEMMAVELGLKDQAPVRAYFHPDGSRTIPPWTDQSILQIHGEAELEQFVKAMRSRGGAR